MADEPKTPGADAKADPPPVTKWHRRDRPYCPIHDVLMDHSTTRQGVSFYYCPELNCACSAQITPQTIRRFDP